MERILDLGEKTVCNVIGKMFALASNKLNCYEPSFCKAWLISSLCERICKMDETLICQSQTYLLNSFIKEIEIPTHKDYEMQEDVLYWAGYTFTYWSLLKGISGKEIAERYDLKSILQQYDILHTQSPKTAISEIESNFSNANIIKNKLFNS